LSIKIPFENDLSLFEGRALTPHRKAEMFQRPVYEPLHQSRVGTGKGSNFLDALRKRASRIGRTAPLNFVLDSTEHIVNIDGNSSAFGGSHAAIVHYLVRCCDGRSLCCYRIFGVARDAADRRSYCIARPTGGAHHSRRRAAQWVEIGLTLKGNRTQHLAAYLTCHLGKQKGPRNRTALLHWKKRRVNSAVSPN
jgi:hypothetical protein